ncbi:MAG: hypothetical protein MJH09_05800 [Cetobacterium sp.]|nr:hypothetical protein [Cetobacterium sp.]
MNRDKFNSLEVIDQIEYINNLLKENKTLTLIAKDLDIGRSTIRDRFKKLNYRYSKELNKYVLNDDIKSVTAVKQEVNKNLKSINTDDLTKYNDSIPDVKHLNEDMKNKLVNVISEYDVLIEMIELYKRNSNIIQSNIIIDLPEAESELTSFRVNKEILEQFNKFAKEQREYRKIDLVSMALKEYMENHKN